MSELLSVDGHGQQRLFECKAPNKQLSGETFFVQRLLLDKKGRLR